MELPTSNDVISTIEAFLVRHDMRPTRFGAESTGDVNLIAALRKGSSPSLNRLHRIRDYMARKDREKVVGVEGGTADHVICDTGVEARDHG